MSFRVSTIKPRHRRLFWIALAALLLLFAQRIIATPTGPARQNPSPVVINEFLAVNDGTQMLDEEGNALSLDRTGQSLIGCRRTWPGGWTLTDDPALPEKWAFESTKLAAGRAS